MTKTLPAESVATYVGKISVFPNPSPVPSMISVMVPPGVILKTLRVPCPATKTLPDESVATAIALKSVLLPSPVPSMISVMVPLGVIMSTSSSRVAVSFTSSNGMDHVGWL